MRKKIVYIFVSAFIFRLILSFLSSHPDINNNVDWGIRFWQYGPLYFYKANVWSNAWPNQPPGTMYMFAGVRKLFEWIFSFFWFINIKVPPFPSGVITYLETNLYPALIKLPSILADLGIGYLIYKFFVGIKKQKLAFVATTVFLFNPVIWYNSSSWGQTDAVINFFALLAFVLLLKKKLFWAMLAFATSIYIKASLLIFAPAFLVIALRQKYSLKTFVVSLLVTLGVVGLVTLPFSGGEPYSWLYNLYKDKVFTEQLQVITANAFNIWSAIAGIHEKPQTLMFGPLSYQNWGTILFSIFYLPSLYLVYKKQDAKSVFWSLSIAAFSSFMLLTNMHERYLYPFFPVFTIVATLEGLLPVYWIISGLSLLNLYNFWFVPRIDFLVNFLSFGDRLMPRILGLFNFGIFIYFYKRFLSRYNLKKLK